MVNIDIKSPFYLLLTFVVFMLGMLIRVYDNYQFESHFISPKCGELVLKSVSLGL